MRFKVYNTMRELSNHADELFPMAHLNETFVLPTCDSTSAGYKQKHPGCDDPGALQPVSKVTANPTRVGADWLQEHQLPENLFPQFVKYYLCTLLHIE